MSHFVFWTLAGFADFKLPFDLMIGVTEVCIPRGSIRVATFTIAAFR